MLYPERLQPFSNDRFRDPPAVYRGTPFWSWNCELDQARLDEQLAVFRDMGFGGAHLHTRVGLSIPYLGEAFMGHIRDSVATCRELGLLAWLYDEDRWPSGFAGGLVTRDRRFRARRLLITRSPLAASKQGTLYAAWQVRWTPEGCLSDCVRLDDEAAAQALEQVLAQARDEDGDDAAARDPGVARSAFESYEAAGADAAELPDAAPVFAFHVIEPDNPRFNNQAYVNTFDVAATERFIELTHERYAEVVGEEFGRTCPPSSRMSLTCAQNRLATAADTRDITPPWSDDFPEGFGALRARHARAPAGIRLGPAGGAGGDARWQIHDYIAERFAAGFADVLGDWCEANGLPLTGHMMMEPTLSSQTAALGDCMRSYRGFEIPGIDILCDHHEYTTAKQCQSAAHQYGREGMLSELYGVTNYNFDFRGYKLQGDWQAALGVTVRVPHLAWVSMLGDAKRDYPPPIGSQSPWYRDWPLLEDHFARVNVALTRGRPLVRIAVIHPVESLWLLWGPGDRNLDRIQRQEGQFERLTELLLTSQLDFDFVAESLLPQLVELAEAATDETGAGAGAADAPPRLALGEMAYDVVVIPDVLTLRATTLAALAAFSAAGGRVLCLGARPALIDGQPAEQQPEAMAARDTLYRGADCAVLERYDLCAALADWRELELVNRDGSLSTDYVTQLREEADGSRWLFVARASRVPGEDIAVADMLTLRLRGLWRVTEMLTADGTSRALEGGEDQARPAGPASSTHWRRTTASCCASSPWRNSRPTGRRRRRRRAGSRSRAPRMPRRSHASTTTSSSWTTSPPASKARPSSRRWRSVCWTTSCARALTGAMRRPSPGCSPKMAPPCACACAASCPAPSRSIASSRSSASPRAVSG